MGKGKHRPIPYALLGSYFLFCRAGIRCRDWWRWYVCATARAVLSSQGRDGSTTITMHDLVQFFLQSRYFHIPEAQSGRLKTQDRLRLHRPFRANALFGCHIGCASASSIAAMVFACVLVCHARSRTLADLKKGLETDGRREMHNGSPGFTQNVTVAIEPWILLGRGC